MQPEIGKIYEGKVTGITKFGAFVELEPNVSGMVHISEVANTFVNEIKDHLTEGQVVKVKVLGISEDGKISLSIKKALPAPPKKEFKPRTDRPMNRNSRPAGAAQGRQAVREPQTPESAFEDMLNKFKASSDERMGDIKRNMDSKRRNTSRRR